MAEIENTYSQICVECGKVFQNPIAFPILEICPECRVFNDNIRKKLDVSRLLTDEEIISSFNEDEHCKNGVFNFLKFGRVIESKVHLLITNRI